MEFAVANGTGRSIAITTSRVADHPAGEPGHGLQREYEETALLFEGRFLLNN
jgi:hypothetical protein